MIEEIKRKIEKYTREIDKGTKITNDMLAKNRELAQQISDARSQLLVIAARKAELQELLAEEEKKEKEKKDDS